MILVLAAVLAVSCTSTEDFTEPSFIHLDGINIGPAATGDIVHGNANFYTSDIVGAYVVAHYPGESKVDTVGLFRMPFTIPLLYNGEVDYIEFYPAVEQSGVALMLPFYTFYNKIRIEDTVLCAGDTLDFGTLTTCYNPQTDYPKLFEPFEPTETAVATDSVVEWVRHDPEGACTGEGYGRVHVTSDQPTVPFSIDKIGSLNYFVFPDLTKIYYMELDIKSDMEVQVWMHAAYTEGGNEDQLSVMNINPTRGEWHHMYIMLGRTWAYFNHPLKVRLSFSALNTEGIDGDVLLDNIKVLSTSVTL